MPNFNPETDIPDLSGKVIIVTGGNIGLGKETVHQLAKHSPERIYLAARSKPKAELAIAELKNDLSLANIIFLELNLGSFKSIKAAAQTFLSSNNRLDLLINNAGVGACPEGLTEDGYEVQFGTNHLGHALFTKLLLPTLQKTTRLPGSDVRIVTLSSSMEGSAPKGAYLFGAIKTPTGSMSSPWPRYGQSKLANLHFSRALSRAYPDIRCVAVHPGAVQTNMISGPMASYPLFAWTFRALNAIISVDVHKGAHNQLWAATSKDAKTGVFYYPVAVAGKDSALARDEKLCQELWNWTEKELEPYM